jgi:hypothetical protein
MQNTLRNSTDEVFSHASEFNKLKQQGLLNSADDVAKHILEIFLRTSDVDFSDKEWLMA